MGGQAAKPPLALEQYATLNAEIEAGEDLAAVLDRESIAKALWLSAQAFWLARMAEEASGKRFETTTRYQALFNAKRKVFESRFERARKKRDRVPTKGPPIEVLAGADAELARPPHTSLPGLSFPEPPQVSPTTARDPYPSGATNSGGGSGPTAARDASPPFMPGAVPFVAHPPKPAFTSARVEPPPPETQQAPPPRKHHATVSFDLPAIPKPATPFAASAAQPAPIPPPLPAKRDLGSTWAAADDSPSMDVPFRKDAPPPVAAGLAAQGVASPAGLAAQGVASPAGLAAQGVASPARTERVRANETAPLPETLQRELREKLGVPAKPNLGATMMADSTFLSTEATPFKKSAGQPALRPLPEPPKPAPLPADDDDDDSPRTKMVDPEAMARAIARATPFTNAGPPRSVSPPLAVPSAPTVPLPPGLGPTASNVASGVKKFSINVFASLTAEIAESPADAENIRQRYGVSDSEHRAESGRWTAEFNQSEELRQRYLGIVQRYRGYIQQRKGG